MDVIRVTCDPLHRSLDYLPSFSRGRCFLTRSVSTGSTGPLPFTALEYIIPVVLLDTFTFIKQYRCLGLQFRIQSEQCPQSSL